MKQSNEDTLLIEQYIDGELNTEEIAVFEKRLKNDKDFKKLYQFRIDMVQKWNEAKQYEAIKNEVVSIAKEQQQKKRQNIFIYSAAAVMVLLLAIPGVLKLMNKTDEVQLAQGEKVAIQINTSKEKGSISYYDKNYQQLRPKNNQLLSSDSLIIFEWNSSLAIETSLVILDKNTKQEVKRISVNSGDKKLQMEQQLLKGEYTWKLEGFEGNVNFIVKDSK